MREMKRQEKTHLKNFPSRIPIPPPFPKTRSTNLKHPPIRHNLLNIPPHRFPHARKALGVGERECRGVETTEVKVAYYGWLEAGEEGVLGGEVGEEVCCGCFVCEFPFRGGVGWGRRGFERSEACLPPFFTEINPLLVDMMNTPHHVFYPPLFPLQQPFKRINIELGDIVCFEPDEEVDLRRVEMFKTVCFVQVRVKRLFEVFRG
jgi:hypothetical protein